MKVYDSKAIALFLKISERRVRQLRDDGIIEEFRPGLYELKDTVNKYIVYLRKGNPNDDENINYNIERALLVRAKRKNEEYELKLKENDLHKTEDIEAVMTNMLANFKTRMMAIPAKLSPTLSKKNDKTEIFKILKESIDEALNELSSFEDVFGEVIKEDEEINDKNV